MNNGEWFLLFAVIASAGVLLSMSIGSYFYWWRNVSVRQLAGVLAFLGGVIAPSAIAWVKTHPLVGIAVFLVTTTSQLWGFTYERRLYNKRQSDRMFWINGTEPEERKLRSASRR